MLFITQLVSTQRIQLCLLIKTLSSLMTTTPLLTFMN